MDQVLLKIDPRASAFLQELQRNSYEALGVEPGHIESTTVPLEQSFQMFKTLSPDTPMSTDLEAFREFWEGHQREILEKCPSQYEDAGLYSIITGLLDDASAALDKMGIAHTELPLFGTLATGRVNGMAVCVPECEAKIVLLERGLFGFANLMCKAVALALLLIGGEDGQLALNVSKDEIALRLANEPQSMLRFGDALVSYVIDGNPHLAEQYTPPPQVAHLASLLCEAMELFIIGHELGHVLAGHLDTQPVRRAMPSGVGTDEISPDWKQEFEADLIGIAVSTQAQSLKGLDLPFSYAGADLFFGCVEIVEKAVGVLASGDRTGFPSHSHPPSAMRREIIRMWLQRKAEDPAQPVKVALAFAAKIEEILDQFWARSEPVLLRMHQEGIRPARWWFGPTT